MSRNLHAVGLDIGASRVRCVIGEVNENGMVDVVGIGQAESRGLKRGIVAKSELVTESIKKAVEDAERISGLEVELVGINLSGEHLRGENKHGVVAVTGVGREISAEDVERVVESASAMQLPVGWEIVERLPQEFIVDGQDGIVEPVGMRGARLESRVHVIISPGVGRQNAVKAVQRAGLEIECMFLEPLAAAEAVLTDDDKEYGSALVHIGADLTSLVIFQGGTVKHTAVFPFGSIHFTKDIAVGLRVSISEAERIKLEFGAVSMPWLSEEERREVIEITPVGKNQVRQLSREILCDMLQPRAVEILQHIAIEVKRATGERQLSSGIILTGGGANLSGIVDVAEQIFDAPTRVGVPERDRFGGLIDGMQGPEWAVAAGLALSSMREQLSEHKESRRRRNAAQKVGEWFSSIRDKFR
jgi:cell division protein FtsA